MRWQGGRRSDNVEDRRGMGPVVGTAAALPMILRFVPGLIGLLFFSTFNNFLGGVFMALLDAYGLSLMKVQLWGLLWAFVSCAFIVSASAEDKRPRNSLVWPMRSKFCSKPPPVFGSCV